MCFTRKVKTTTATHAHRCLHVVWLWTMPNAFDSLFPFVRSSVCVLLKCITINQLLCSINFYLIIDRRAQIAARTSPLPHVATNEISELSRSKSNLSLSARRSFCEKCSVCEKHPFKYLTRTSHAAYSKTIITR